MPLQGHLLLVLLLVSYVACADAVRLAGPRSSWNPRHLELEADLTSVAEVPPVLLAEQACFNFSDCNVTCTVDDLVLLNINSADYACLDDILTITVETASEDAVLRMRLNDGSNMAVDESLTVLEDGDTVLAVLTESQEAWVASRLPSLTLEYLKSNDSESRVQLSLVAYNQTQDEQEYTTELTGVLEAPEQAHWTGSDDYAVNTERYWHLNLLEVATCVNFTVANLNLDPAAGDVLIIGSGKGPYATEPTAELLTGKFSKRRYHVPGGEAFVYFLSGSHAEPRAPFKVTYTAEPIVGPTTTVPTTTDRDHPPTPANVNFQLDCFASGIDPQRFLNASDPALGDLQATLAYWANFYKRQHSIPAWRDVHQDDIQFSAWMMCDSTSGWVKNDANCVRVTWFIELLREDGDWAFLHEDLRGIIIENGESINEDLQYQFTLTLDEVNSTWWWAITIALVPLAIIAFALVMWITSRDNKIKNTYDENASLADLDQLDVEHQNKIDMERQTFNEDDQQLKKVFHDDDNFQEYDPELHGAHRQRDLHIRFQQQQKPLKSALKTPKTAPAAYTNAAFEGDDGGVGVRTSFLPEEPVTVAAPAAAAAAPVAAPLTGETAAPAALPTAAASSELTEQLRLLNELNKALKEEERQAPGIELPRVEGLVKPTKVESKLYSMNEDGTGTEVDVAHPGDNILQLDDNSSDGNRKTSSV